MVTIEAAGTADAPATDLGFLLHKHPDRVQTFATSQGTATVFYPVSTAAACRVVLHVDGEGAKVAGDHRYVNAVRYEASSRLVVALGKVFGDAVAGRCAKDPDLVDREWDLRITVPSVPLRGPLSPGDLFGPLGWDVDVEREPLTPPEWGDSRYGTLALTGRHTLAAALRHLSVLLPVLAGDKHYFVDESEVEKLERLGAGWLSGHPHRDDIARAFVKRLHSLADLAIARISPEPSDPTAAIRPIIPSLAARRADRVAELVRADGGRSVLDVGCGEGRLLDKLAAEGSTTRLAGVDVSASELQRAQTRLQRWRGIDLWQSSLMYADDRCRGHDVVVLMEVIEHLDPDRLDVATASVFDGMAPRTAIVTTPNRDHNPRYGLRDGEFRHPDHRFEFTRAEFDRWCAAVADDFGYTVTRHGIGDPDVELGAPTQCAVFTRIDTGEESAS